MHIYNSLLHCHHHLGKSTLGYPGFNQLEHSETFYKQILISKLWRRLRVTSVCKWNIAWFSRLPHSEIGLDTWSSSSTSLKQNPRP